MTENPLDNPIITSMLFHPRSAKAGTSSAENTVDGTIAIEDGIEVGYQFFIGQPTSPLIFYFHGNGETAGDYDYIAPMYREIGLSLLVVDYRGYGWSTGKPLTSKMIPDAEQAFAILPDIIKQNGIEDVPIFVKGRSLGSASAIHLAYKFPEKLCGLIVESGFSDAPSVFRRLGIPVPHDMAEAAMMPIANARKMESVELPLLVIHGENDTLLPIQHGKAIFDASPSDRKTFIGIAGAGHNDLLRQREIYFQAVARFVRENSTQGNN